MTMQYILDQILSMRKIPDYGALTYIPYNICFQFSFNAFVCLMYLKQWDGERRYERNAKKKTKRTKMKTMPCFNIIKI